MLGLLNLIANEPDVSQGGRAGVVQRQASSSQSCPFLLGSNRETPLKGTLLHPTSGSLKMEGLYPQGCPQS